MDVCQNFQLSLTGGFQECRNCKKEKKFHVINFDCGTIEYVPKTTNSNACIELSNLANLLQSKKEQVVAERQMEEDILKSKACDKFELALTGAFNQCKNCKIDKKYHKLETAGQIAYQPRSSLAKSVQQNPQPPKPSAMSEIVQETMMVQSVKDRIAQMNKNTQKPVEHQFRSSYKPEVKEKAPCVAEVVTEQVFTTVSDKKSVFDKPRVRKTIEEANHYIREHYQQHENQDEQFRRAESEFTQEQQQEEIHEQQHDEAYVDQQQFEQQEQQAESNEQQENEQQSNEQNEQHEQQLNEQQESNEQNEQQLNEQQEQNDQQQNEQQESNQEYEQTEQINQQEQKVEDQEPVQQQEEVDQW